MQAGPKPLELTGRGLHATMRMNRLKRPGLARGVPSKEGPTIRVRVENGARAAERRRPAFWRKALLGMRNVAVKD